MSRPIYPEMQNILHCLFLYDQAKERLAKAEAEVNRILSTPRWLSVNSEYAEKCTKEFADAKKYFEDLVR